MLESALGKARGWGMSHYQGPKNGRASTSQHPRPAGNQLPPGVQSNVFHTALKVIKNQKGLVANTS